MRLTSVVLTSWISSITSKISWIAGWPWSNHVCVCVWVCVCVCLCAIWCMGRKNKNKYWDFLSGNLDFGLEKSWKNHGTFFWDFCGNPALRQQDWGLAHNRLLNEKLIQSWYFHCHFQIFISWEQWHHWNNKHHAYKMHMKLWPWHFEAPKFDIAWTLQRDKIHLSLIASRGNKEYNVILNTLHSYKSMLKKIIRLSKRKYYAEQFEKKNQT